MILVRRTAIGVTLGLLVALFVAALFVLLAPSRSFPTTDGVLEIDGVHERVEIHRDAYGVPTIIASDERDLWFAQGYVHAQDRFWEMDLRRHATAGRLAELFGSSQVPTDTFVRTLGLRDIAEAEVADADDETRRMLEAYAAGVNAWMDGRRASRLSLEHGMLRLTGPLRYRPEPWGPADSVAWLKAMAWDLADVESDLVRARLSVTDLGPDRDWRTLYPDAPGTHPPIIPDGGSYADGSWLPAATHGRAVDAEADDEADTSADVETDAADNGAGDDLDGPAPDEPADDADDSPAADDADADMQQAAASAAYADAELLARAHDALRTLPTSLGRGEGIGSNSWVVAPDHSAGSGALLAVDPHLEPSLPGPWYQVGLRCEPVTDACPYQVAGVSFAGLPGVIMGRTDGVAWGLTQLAASDAELVVERLDDDRYLDGAQWRDLEVRTETIRVARGRDVDVAIRSTSSGPLITDLDTHAHATAAAWPRDHRDRTTRSLETGIALRWSALIPSTTADALPRFARARSADDIVNAARLLDAPNLHVVYADDQGDIGYLPAGRLAGRRGEDGWVPIDGWLPVDRLDDLAPLQGLDDARRPWIRNPPSGFIVAANQQVLPPGDEPVLTRAANPGFRAARIDALLQASSTLDVDDLARMQADTRHPFADDLVSLLIELATDDETDLVRRELAGWDGRGQADSPGAAAFNAVWRHLLAHAFHDELAPWAHPDDSGRWAVVVQGLLATPEHAWWDDITDLDVQTRDDVLRSALRDAQDELVARFGDDSSRWRWGELHTLTLRHSTFGSSGIALIERLFNRGPYPTPGGIDAVNATAWDASEGYAATKVPSVRIVMDLADADAGRWVQLTGQSARPRHPHYVDQTPLWLQGETVPFTTSRAAAQDRAVDTLVLIAPIPEE